MQATSRLTPGGPAAPPWYTERWPWLLMLGPALVVIGGSYAGYLAYSRPDAMVVDDYYNQGKAINQDLRRDRAATALGLVFGMRYDPARAMLDGSLSGAEGPVTAPFRLYLAHATQPAKDQQLLVQPDAAGKFSVPLAMLGQGRWQVVVEGMQRDWRLARNWHWPRQRALAIVADVPVAPPGGQ